MPEVLGASRLAWDTDESDPPRGAVDAPAHPLYGRAGSHLSAHDVRHHGARSAGLSQRSSGYEGSRETVLQFAGRRRAGLFLSAMFLAGMGYGDRGIRAGRIG